MRDARRLNSLCAMTLFVLALFAQTGLAETTIESQCEALALRIGRDPSFASAIDRAQTLERQGGHCFGTGAFDVILAARYQDAGALADSDRVARRGLEVASKFRPNLLQVLAENDYRRGKIDEAYRMGQEIAQAFPNYAPIYGFLGDVDVKLKRWAKALEDAKRINEIEGSAISYLAMAGALYQMERYPEVVVSVNRALELEPGRVGKTTGILEGIYALVILNRRQEATELLRRHISANPKWKENAAMVRVARELGE